MLVTHNGYSAAVMMSVEEYESLIETLEILSDPELMAQLRKAKKEKEKGKFLTHEEVWG